MRSCALFLLLSGLQLSTAVRQQFQTDGTNSMMSGDAIDICGANVDGRQLNGGGLLEPIVATSRGNAATWELNKKRAHAVDKQGEYPYHLPDEVLIVCNKDSSRVGQIRYVDTRKRYRDITVEERADLFGTLTKVFVHSPERRTPSENGNFVFVVDIDGNLLIAPIMQGTNPVEMKHGDLTPGQTPLSRPVPQPGAAAEDVFENHNAGAYRGLARLGGEFNLVNNTRNAWIIHQKSGYALNRIDPSDVHQFQLAHPELDDNDVWEYLSTGCFKTKSLGMDALEKLGCYMQSAFAVNMQVQASASCYFGSDAEASKTQGNMPVLSQCTPIARQSAGPCANLPEMTGVPSMVTLAEWVPKDGTCDWTSEDVSHQLEHLANLIEAYELLSSGTSVAAQGILEETQAIIKALKRTPCWTSNAFQETVRSGCPLSSCLNEQGMQSIFKNFKNVKRSSMETIEGWWLSSGGVGVLNFWNARCKPVPVEADCAGHKAKYDYKCVGKEKEDCQGEKKCYWPPDAPSDVGVCLGHKFKEDIDCIAYRSKLGCDIDDDCFWTEKSQYDSHGKCMAHKFSDDRDCAKYRTAEACQAKSDCFFLAEDESDSYALENEGMSCVPRMDAKSDKDSKKCTDYRRLKCQDKNKVCAWQRV